MFPHRTLPQKALYTRCATRRDAISDKREAKAGKRRNAGRFSVQRASNGRQRQKRQKREILQWLIRSTGQLFVFPFLSLSLSPPSFPLSLHPLFPCSNVWTHIVISMDVRTRPIVNLIILVTSDKRCRQNVIPTRSLTRLVVLVWNSK